MRKYEGRIQRLLALMVVAAAAIALTMQGQSQKNPTVSKEVPRKQRDLPVADFEAKEPTDVQAREKRRSKSSRYDRHSSQRIEDAPWIEGRVQSSHWAQGLSALPVTVSDVVLIGGVLDAQAHLSNDRTGIYSEFNVQVEEVLKDGAKGPVYPGRVVSLERYGGAVRFPSGSIQRFETWGQGMPRVGERYLFFLKREGETDFSIVTGYQLDVETVVPLDGAAVEGGTEKYPFDSYRGFDVSTFLQMVRTEIAPKPSRTF